MSEYIILSAREFDFTNDRQERVQGVKLSYINPKVQQEGVKGFEPMLASVPAVFADSLGHLPGRYRMSFEVVTGPKNKPQLQLTELECLAPVDFHA